MTTQEAADALHLSRIRILQLIKDKRLIATKRGRDWWIEQSALDALVIETKYRTTERKARDER